MALPFPLPLALNSAFGVSLKHYPDSLFGGPALVLAAPPSVAQGADIPHVLMAGDADGDGVFDPLDNCVERPNVDLLDADDDGLGDRYCDPTPASCPERPLDAERCSGSDQFVSGDLCVERVHEQTEFAWRWRPAHMGRPLPDPGDPIHELPHYSLCIYNVDGPEPKKVAEAAALPWPQCGEPPCWTGSRRDGFIYRGDRALLGTLDEAIIPPVDAAVPTLYAKGHEEVALSAFGERSVVQLLLRREGETYCWGSSHMGIRPLSECPIRAIEAASAAP